MRMEISRHWSAELVDVAVDTTGAFVAKPKEDT